MTARQANLAGFLACAGMMGYAFYAQMGLGLEPCPLCMFERVGVVLLGLAFLGNALLAPVSGWGRGVGIAALLLAAVVPAGVATRHVYIQSLPEGSVPSCGATLDYMLEVFPVFTVVRKVLTGGRRVRPHRLDLPRSVDARVGPDRRARAGDSAWSPTCGSRGSGSPARRSAPASLTGLQQAGNEPVIPR